MADSSKKKWFPWRRRSQAPQTPRPESREVAAAQVTDKYSEYPSDGLTPVRLAEIFKEADAGDVLRQAELFEEMEEKDPHLFSQLQTRKNAVTGLDYEVIPFDSDDPRDKEIAEFVEAQLGGIEGFEDIMLDLLDAIGKGFAVSEIMWSYDEGHVVVDDIRSRHQKRFFWDSVDDSFKVRTQEAPEGIELPKNKFIVHKYKARSGHPSRAGVLRVVAWMYLFKNYTLKDWVAFCEVFGMPLRLGKYQPGASEDDKRALMQALVAIGADAAGIFPDGTAIEFVNTEKTSSTDLYERLARYCDEQVSKAILGQTLTSDSGGGSYAQSKTHNDVRHDLTVADCKAIAATLRRDLIRPLVSTTSGRTSASRTSASTRRSRRISRRRRPSSGRSSGRRGSRFRQVTSTRSSPSQSPRATRKSPPRPGRRRRGRGSAPSPSRRSPASRSRSRPRTERGTGRKSASTVWRQRPPGKAPGPSRKRSARFSKRLRTRRALRNSGT